MKLPPSQSPQSALNYGRSAPSSGWRILAKAGSSGGSGAGSRHTTQSSLFSPPPTGSHATTAGQSKGPGQEIPFLPLSLYVAVSVCMLVFTKH